MGKIERECRSLDEELKNLFSLANLTSPQIKSSEEFLKYLKENRCDVAYYKRKIESIKKERREMDSINKLLITKFKEDKYILN